MGAFQEQRVTENERRQTLADFLRTRRARLTPEDVGLIGGGRRRTPGLRREEVAYLANIGLSWYVALEQARDVQPSGSVLNNIADALHLNPAERRHLMRLANAHAPEEQADADEKPSAGLLHIIADLNPTPAFITGQRWNYLAWNDAADRLMELSHKTGRYARNLVWQLFTDPAKRSFYPDWNRVAQKVVGEFRADTAPFMGEAWFSQLVADLSEASPDFARLWQTHDVRESIDGRKEMIHPMLGQLVFEHTTLHIPAQPGLKLLVFTPVAETAERLAPVLEGRDSRMRLPQLAHRA